jgi:hypothetical protein
VHGLFGSFGQFPRHLLLACLEFGDARLERFNVLSGAGEITGH